MDTTEFVEERDDDMLDEAADQEQSSSIVQETVSERRIRPNYIRREVGGPSSDFYINCIKEVHDVKGQQDPEKTIINRLAKYHKQDGQLAQGYRFRRKIYPDYQLPTTVPVPHAVLIYGTDYFSNKDLRTMLKFEKKQVQIKRINWSNTVLIFESTEQAKGKLQEFVLQKEGEHPFFKIKQEEVQEQEGAVELQIETKPKYPYDWPIKWYCLKPFQHKDIEQYWFIRYITNLELEQLDRIKEEIQNKFIYESAKIKNEARKKNQESFYESNYPSRESSYIQRSSMNGNSQRSSLKREKLDIQGPSEERERSRQKIAGSGSRLILNDLDKTHPNPDESFTSDKTDLSHVCYRPIQNENEMNRLLNQMNNLELSGVVDREGMQNAMDQTINQFEGDMSFMNIPYETDPYGKPDRLVRENETEIQRLTKLSQNEKWDYKAYTEQIMRAEEQNKQKGKETIAFIEID